MRLGIAYSPSDVAHLPTLWAGDVAVVGGGSAGAAAAVAAARAGARTLVVERAGWLGGTGVAVLDTFYGFYAPGTGRQVVGGVGWEVCERLHLAGAAFERPNTYGAGTGVTYEPEHLKLVWDELVEEAGAESLLHAAATAVVLEQGGLRGLVVETRQGPQLVRARAFVDATGDAELAWRAAAALERPGPARRLQPCTTTSRICAVAVGAVAGRELQARMQEVGDGYRLPRREGSTHRTLLPGVVHTNLTRVSGLDPTDPWQLAEGEREGRRQVHEYLRFLQREVPGYEQALLSWTSTWLGVRESRRLLGQYVLDRDDVLSARRHVDDIALCGAPIEDHDAGEGTRWEHVGGQAGGPTYGIPFRCLVPRDVRGLLVAGRCLSATHDAHASVRSMAQCMATGQAAGTAAALALQTGVELGEVDTELLRKRLSEEGALL